MVSWKKIQYEAFGERIATGLFFYCLKREFEGKKEKHMKKRNLWVILTGVVIGLAALALTALGNPGNMGFCIACFIRDTAGALKLHSARSCNTSARKSSA